MSKSKGRNSTRASERRRPKPISINLPQAEHMLPLVAQIVEDIQTRWNHLVQLEKEQIDLDRRRHSLNWPQRSRRYQVADEITSEQRRLQDSVTELEQLNVVLVDPVHGEAAFPTLIQGKRSFFVWRLGSPDVRWWCHANEPNRHVIPAHWRKPREKSKLVEE